MHVLFCFRRSLRQKKSIAAAVAPIIDLTQNVKIKITNAIKVIQEFGKHGSK